MMETNNNIEIVEKLFSEIPPDLAEIDQKMAEYSLSKKELSEIAVYLVDDCFCEKQDALYFGKSIDQMEKFHSYYLYDSMKLLLKHGYDPNINTDDDNAMCNVHYIDFPDIGAKVLRLLIENGGDLYIKYPGDHLPYFIDIDHQMTWDMYEHEYAHVVQCWLVFIGYGARYESGQLPLDMLNGNSPDIFRNFEDYDYYIEHKDEYVNGKWIMHIFNKHTKEEVARY